MSRWGTFYSWYLCIKVRLWRTNSASVNYLRTCSWNQPVLSNLDWMSYSRNQREHLFRFKMKPAIVTGTYRLQIRRAYNCVTWTPIWLFWLLWLGKTTAFIRPATFTYVGVHNVLVLWEQQGFNYGEIILTFSTFYIKLLFIFRCWCWRRWVCIYI